jgi:S1-C subfamily serine protease
MNTRFSILCLLLLLAQAAPVRGDGPGDSVVKVYATIRGPDLLRPWAKQNAIESVGSGVVIEGRQILTNAHVLLYASEVFVQGKDGGEKVEAKVKSIGVGYDLALLTVENPDFFARRPALPRAKSLPKERDTVEVYGYPIGGTNQSVTKGIVSRIDFVPYTTETWGVRVQIDAALNPGNSGGPALVGDQMIGVAFSRFPLGIGANIGYIIPNEEIEAFLKDPANKPRLPGNFQPLQNETIRQKLGLDDKTQGILAHHDSGPIQKLDVLTHLGPHPLDNQGLVKVTDTLHFNYQYLVPKLARKGKIPATVVRAGKEVKLNVPVSRWDDFVLSELKGKYPSYFLYGPLVFSPATLNTANQFARADISSPLLQRQGEKVRFPGEELVLVACPMLRHKCVRGYNDPVGRVVAEVNGVKVKNLRHLVEVLRDCQDDHVTFAFAGRLGEVLVLARKDMTEVTRQVMDDNSIPRRGSADLVELWKKGQRY